MTLQEHAVSGELLDALHALQGETILSAFYLVGGTSLALRFGHRRSIDIDLFTGRDFDAYEVGNHLSRQAGVSGLQVSTNTVRGIMGRN